MLASIRQCPMLQSARSALPRLLVFAASLSIGACDGADDPLAPTDSEDVPVPASAAAAPDQALAALTSPRIAISAYRVGDQSDIFSMDSQGNSFSRLTTTPVVGEGQPAWSWDNKRIVLVSPRKDGSDQYHNDIYVINADGSNGHWARPFAANYHLQDPQWSPDGSRILLTVYLPGYTPYLAYINVATGALDLIGSTTGGVKGSQPSYDPTGKKIVYIGSTGRSMDQVNADGSGHTYLIGVSAKYLSYPTFSPDGKRIAFDKPVNGDQEIFVRNANGIVKRLTTSPGLDNHATWSPDGRTIAFISKRSGQHRVWTKNLVDGSLKQITKTGGEDWAPAYSH